MVVEGPATSSVGGALPMAPSVHEKRGDASEWSPAICGRDCSETGRRSFRAPRGRPEHLSIRDLMDAAARLNSGAIAETHAVPSPGRGTAAETAPEEHQRQTSLGS